MATNTESVDLVGDEAAANLARAALFAALVGAFAYVSFPFPVSPAPVTLQVLGVFLAGIFLGPIWGAVALVLYLAAGALGAPVFSGGAAGFGALVGPTGPLAAGLVGAVVHRGAGLRDLDGVSAPVLVAAMTAGTVVVYAMGVVGLYLTLDLTLVESVVQGAAVFLPAEGAKMAAAIGIVRSDAIAAE